MTSNYRYQTVMKAYIEAVGRGSVVDHASSNQGVEGSAPARCRAFFCFLFSLQNPNVITLERIFANREIDMLTISGIDSISGYRSQTDEHNSKDSFPLSPGPTDEGNMSRCRKICLVVTLDIFD